MLFFIFIFTFILIFYFFFLLLSLQGWLFHTTFLHPLSTSSVLFSLLELCFWFFQFSTYILLFFCQVNLSFQTETKYFRFRFQIHNQFQKPCHIEMANNWYVKGKRFKISQHLTTEGSIKHTYITSARWLYHHGNKDATDFALFQLANSLMTC